MIQYIACIQEINIPKLAERLLEDLFDNSERRDLLSVTEDLHLYQNSEGPFATI